MRTGKSCAGIAVGSLALLFAAAVPAQTPTDEARILLAFCLAHPEAYSISIDYSNGASWHIDHNGTRLNTLASTIKVVHLIA